MFNSQQRPEGGAGFTQPQTPPSQPAKVQKDNLGSKVVPQEHLPLSMD